MDQIQNACQLIHEKIETWFDTLISMLPNIFVATLVVKTAYDENDITITFPIRTLDFGIKGGNTLADMMNEAEEKK